MNENVDKVVEVIKKFKELLDMGAITQEEYNSKKAELLKYDVEMNKNTSTKITNNSEKLEELQLERAELEAKKILIKVFNEYLDKNEKDKLYEDEVREEIINEIGSARGCLIGEIAMNLYYNTLKQVVEEFENDLVEQENKIFISNTTFYFIAVIFSVIFIVLLGVKFINGSGRKVNNDLEAQIYSEKIFNIDSMNSELQKNFTKACNDIGIETAQIKNISRVDDWIGGERYNFSYKQMPMKVYCNADNTINSINIGNYKPYLQGYQSISIENFIVDISIADNLIPKIQNKVKLYLNYPNTANFDALGWGYSRCDDIYGISGSLTAQNTFGVEDNISFYAEYKVDDKNSSLVYLVINGNDKVGKESQMKEFERMELKQVSSENNEIVLVDGVIGQYGNIVRVGNYDYIWYYIPEGKYSVISNVKWCKVFLDKNKTIKNSDGYEESVNVTTLTFNGIAQQQELEVKDGQHILLSVNAKVTLNKKLGEDK